MHVAHRPWSTTYSSDAPKLLKFAGHWSIGRALIQPMRRARGSISSGHDLSDFNSIVDEGIQFPAGCEINSKTME